VTYSESVAAAPPGAAEFGRADLERLPADVLERLLERVPEDEWRLLEAGDDPAARRVVRALFWDLVYHLRPERWDELSRAEPVHPGVLEALPADGARVLEIAAGSGRLTVELAPRARSLIAIEPAGPLREILRGRLPGIAVLDATAEELPVAGGWADLTVSCASLGPDPRALRELERCTRPGGTLALVSPMDPGWFEAHGWRRLSFDPREVPIPPHDPSLEAFFGPLNPPHELLLKAQ
jgi:SAM-dependent methyltransferase